MLFTDALAVVVLPGSCAGGQSKWTERQVVRVSRTPDGVQACVIKQAGAPLKKARPVGVVIIVIVYWAMTVPQFSAVHSVLTALLHAAITAVTVQLGLHVSHVTSKYASASASALAAGFGVVRCNAQRHAHHS